MFAYDGRLKAADRLLTPPVSLLIRGVTGQAACFKELRGGVECVVRQSGGATKERRSGVLRFPKPGCRLWTSLP
jgi:hypothetical protein